jgi:hypothetical protein
MRRGQSEQRAGIGARWARREHTHDVVDTEDRRVLGDRHLQGTKTSARWS